MTTPTLEDLRPIILDPVRFARGILRHKTWRVQEEMLRSIAENPRTAVKSCHASSKTFCAAEAALWWLARYSDGVVVTTSATANLVRLEVWGEIHKALEKSRLAYPTPNQTELVLSPGCYAVGLSTNTAERFQGFHGRILIIIDEAPGVKPAIWEAIEGIRAGGYVHVVALGNPTIASGPFFDAFTSERDTWKTITIDAFDTPNLEGLTLETLLALSEAELDIKPWPNLISRRWVKEKYENWGPDNPLWQSRVRGQFPVQAEDALLSLAWLEAAKYQEAPIPYGPIRAGVDVAGPGEDETVLAIRQGGRLMSLASWAQADPRGEVVAALAPYRGQLERVNVDTVGIGYYLAQHLRDLDFPVYDINVGEAPDDKEKYSNLKAELYWGLRQRFQAGDMSGLDDETAIAQLAGIRYKHNARGQVMIESKDDARKRGVKSPDRAEAIMLAFAGRDIPESFEELQKLMEQPERGQSVAEMDAIEEERVKERVF